jgi:hypothetical protein
MQGSVPGCISCPALQKSSSILGFFFSFSVYSAGKRQGQRVPDSSTQRLMNHGLINADNWSGLAHRPCLEHSGGTHVDHHRVKHDHLHCKIGIIIDNIRGEHCVPNLCARSIWSNVNEWPCEPPTPPIGTHIRRRRLGLSSSANSYRPRCPKK